MLISVNVPGDLADALMVALQSVQKLKDGSKRIIGMWPIPSTIMAYINIGDCVCLSEKYKGEKEI
jgi:hypothetical protein